MIQQINEGHIKTEKHKGITTIEFFHPKRNSLPAKILEILAQEIHSAGMDDDTKVIILRSEGESTFCSGASFDELLTIKTREEGLRFFTGFANVINAMRKCPKFIIGRIHGKCVGGGVGLAAAVDYAIASFKADIRLSELEMGIGPFVVGPAVERKIGTAAFSALSIDAHTWRSSDWAKRKNLYAELHEDSDNMDESVNRLSSTLSHSNPEAMAEMKKIFWNDTDHWDVLLKERAAISGRLVLSDFSKNAIEKFKATKK